MKALLCAGVSADATIAIAARESKLGTGVSLEDATPTKAPEPPEAFVGKTVRVVRVATSLELPCRLVVLYGNLMACELPLTRQDEWSFQRHSGTGRACQPAQNWKLRWMKPASAWNASRPGPGWSKSAGGWSPGRPPPPKHAPRSMSPPS